MATLNKLMIYFSQAEKVVAENDQPNLGEL
jgi:hypothetical protein